jgi:V/A-type H+/Na+-transporting ATPase subunit E
MEMESMQKISEDILGKVTVEAGRIIEEAETKRQLEISKAEQQRAAKHDEAKHKMLEDAQKNAAKLISQASIKSRQAWLETKVSIINEIISGTKTALANKPGTSESLLNIIKEAIDGMRRDRVRLFVAPTDMAAAKVIIKDDAGLTSSITEIKEYNCLGGAIVEDMTGKLRIDNTYETRLEMLLPKLLPDISKQLFETET